MTRQLLTALVLMFAMPTAGAQTAVLRFATVAPDGSSWMNEMRAGAEEINRRTEGRVRIQYFPGGVMGNEQAVLRRIRIGQLHGGAFTSGALATVYSGNLLYSLPFLFRSLEEVDYVRSRMDERIERGLEQSGLVSLGFAGGGFAQLMSTVPVAGVDDLRGQKVWIPEGDPVAYAAMREMGLSPVTLPLTDVLTGLQTGLVNVVITPPVGAVAFQWHTRVRYITDTPLAYTWAQLVIDQRALRRLSGHDQQVLREVMRDIYDRLDQRNRDDNRQATRAMLRQGIERVVPPREERRRWEDIAARVNRDLVENGTIDRALFEQLQAHLDDFRRAAVTGL